MRESLRQTLCRLLVARKTTEDHAGLCVEIRQRGILGKRLVRKAQHLLIGIMEGTHGLNHLVIDLALLANKYGVAAQHFL